MSSGLDTAFVRDTYRRMADAELIRVATQDAAGLTDEAYEIIIEEIARRNLSPDIQKGVEAQQKIPAYSIEEIDNYCELIRQLPCPISGRTDAPLNATYTEVVMSFVVITQIEKKIVVACPDELDKASNQASIQTALLGWWGIPWGPIRTIRALIRNGKSKGNNHSESPNNYLRSLVLAKIGQIETYRNDSEKLMSIIQ